MVYQSHDHNSSKLKMAKLGNLKVANTVFFLCDIQERFRPTIKYFEQIVNVSQRMVEGSKLLNIPLIVTEQYPKGLGETVAELQSGISHATKFPKTDFTMVLPEVEHHLNSLCGGQMKHVVLFGIETHVCVQQTVIDLLERGIEVHIVADATSSRSQQDRLIALQRFRVSGAIVTTSEAVLLQLVGSKNHPQFKAIQGLIRESAPDTGLVPSLL